MTITPLIAQVAATCHPDTSVACRIRRLANALQHEFDRLPTPRYTARIPVRVQPTLEELSVLLPTRFAKLYAIEKTGQHGIALLGQPGFRSRTRLSLVSQTTWSVLARYCGGKPVWKILRTIPHGKRRTLRPLLRYPDLIVWVPPTLPICPPLHYLTTIPHRAFQPRPTLRTPIVRRVRATAPPSTPSELPSGREPPAESSS